MTDEQIVAILQEAEKGEKTLADLCKEKGISQNTFYTWRRKLGYMQTNEVKKLRELEKEHARLTTVARCKTRARSNSNPARPYI